jgi:hypothetical protein
MVVVVVVVQVDLMAEQVALSLVATKVLIQEKTVLR